MYINNISFLPIHDIHFSEMCLGWPQKMHECYQKLFCRESPGEFGECRIGPIVRPLTEHWSGSPLEFEKCHFSERQLLTRSSCKHGTDLFSARQIDAFYALLPKILSLFTPPSGTIVILTCVHTQSSSGTLATSSSPSNTCSKSA